jgi:nucleoside 2-deoxyribosyltransferase
MANARVKVYVASPLGFSDLTRRDVYEKVLTKIALIGSVDILDPWEKVAALSSTQLRESAARMTLEEAFAIGNTNIEHINNCDAVFAILDGTDVDGGVAWEMGFGCALGKKVIGVRTDFRLASEVPCCLVNPQIEAGVAFSGGHVHGDMESAIQELSAFVSFKRGAYKSEKEALADLKRKQVDLDY